MRICILLGMPGLALAACDQAEPWNGRIEPGLWEVTQEFVSAESGGRPNEMTRELVGRRTTTQNCYAPERAAELFHEPGECTGSFSISDGRMRGRRTCALELGSTRTVEGEFGPESFDVVTTVTNPGMFTGASSTVAVHGVGRRIGDCPPASRS